MLLQELIHKLPIHLAAGPNDADITHISDDSRQITPNSLFIARPGPNTNGQNFINQAIHSGAIAILSTTPLYTPQNVSLLLSKNVTSLTGTLVERFLNYPARHLKIIGITGTNGKSTTAHIIRHILNNSNKRCGLIGTLEIDNGKTSIPSSITTPGAIQLSNTFSEMVKNNCQFCVMETSSHALHQHRTDHINFNIALFTNLTGDHLDYHHSIDDYTNAKARLFNSLNHHSFAIVNADDPASKHMLQNCDAKTITFSLNDRYANCYALIHNSSATNTNCSFNGPWGSFTTTIPLIGRHNVANMLGAIAATHALGISPQLLQHSIQTCPPVPGRLEPVTPKNINPNFTILVDYAHTDDALASALRTLRPLTKARLRVLFGCGGDRDITKRPRMAAIAHSLADDIVITSDNPRTEDPIAIIKQTLKGIPQQNRSEITAIPDRRDAIRKIITDAKPNDIVLLAGKGHENYQIIGHDKLPFDDRLHAAQILTQLFTNTK